MLELSTTLKVAISAFISLNFDQTLSLTQMKLNFTCMPRKTPKNSSNLFGFLPQDSGNYCSRCLFIQTSPVARRLVGCQEMAYWLHFVLFAAISVPQCRWSRRCYDGATERCAVVPFSFCSVCRMSKKVKESFNAFFSVVVLFSHHVEINYLPLNLSNWLLIL